MRLLVHNLLQCPKTKTYPLRLQPTELETIESEYNGAFILRILPRLEWGVLRQVAQELELGQLPDAPPQQEEGHEELFQLLHSILMDTHVKEGQLISQDGSATYPIRNGIPNLLVAPTTEAS